MSELKEIRLLSSTLKFSAKVVLPIAVLLVAAVAYAALKASKPGLSKRQAPEQISYVKAFDASFSDHQPQLHLFGETTAGRRVELRALVSGEVLSSSADMREGAIVKKGAVLLQIDPFNFEGRLDEAQSRLVEAKARLNELDASYNLEENGVKFDRAQLGIAQKDLNRAVSLARRKTVSRKVVDDRRSVVTQRSQEMERRQNNLKVWKAKADQQRAVIKRLKWGVKQAQRRLSETKLVAPFDAYVSEANAEVGRLLNASDRVATLIDRNWIETRFTLTDKQYGQIVAHEGTVIGREIEVLWRLGERDFSYKARIERVAAKISSERGGVDLYARLNSPEKPIPIRVGAFVEIRVPDRKYENVLRVPSTAIYNSSRIYIIEKGRLVERKIKVVGRLDEDVLVRGDVRAGDRVVRTRLTRPGDGLRVKELL